MLCYFQVYSKVIQLYLYLYIFFTKFFSIIGYYKTVTIVPCAIQQDLVIYLIFIKKYVSVNPKLLNYPSPTPFTFSNHSFFFSCVLQSEFKEIKIGDMFLAIHCPMSKGSKLF